MTEKKNIYIYININIFEIYILFIFLFYLFIYLFIFIIIFRYAIAYLRTGSYAPAMFHGQQYRKSFLSPQIYRMKKVSHPCLFVFCYQCLKVHVQWSDFREIHVMMSIIYYAS